MSKQRLPIGTETTINGRRLSLRRYTARTVEWWDIEAKAIVKTSHNWKPDRKSASQRDTWEARATREGVSAKVREQIKALAVQVGLPVSVAAREFLEASKLGS